MTRQSKTRYQSLLTSVSELIKRLPENDNLYDQSFHFRLHEGGPHFGISFHGAKHKFGIDYQIVVLKKDIVLWIK